MESADRLRARRVSLTAAVPLSTNGPFLTYRSLHAARLGGVLDPVIGIDDFHMSEPVFPPHPHAGLSAVTYMFEDSEGTFLNRDSQGDYSFIHPGDLHWTEAAGGILHDEVPTELGRSCHGAQIFVNLPASEKESSARTYHLRSGNVPEVTPPGGGRIRVLVGALAGKQSPLAPRTQLMLLDVHLPPSASVEIPLPGAWNAVAFIIRGEGQLGPKEDARALREGNAVGFVSGGEHVAARTGEHGLQFLLSAGPPLNEPLIQYGPFVASSRPQLQRYVEAYQSGRMGHLRPCARKDFPIPVSTPSRGSAA